MSGGAGFLPSTAVIFKGEISCQQLNMALVNLLILWASYAKN